MSRGKAEQVGQHDLRILILFPDCHRNYDHVRNRLVGDDLPPIMVPLVKW
jgi:hypothetical protein